MEYRETLESKNLVKLNQDYLDVYYSRAYQKYINRNVRKLSPSIVLNEFKTGYYMKRIKSIVTGGQRQSTTSSATEERKNLRTVDTSERIAVYTVIIGDYDTLKQPLYVSPQCDYFVLSDHEINTEGTDWRCMNVNSYFEGVNYSNTKKARFVKTHPHLFFKEYKYSIFLDGNFLIVGDLVPLVEMLADNVFATHLHPSNDCIYQEAKDIIALGKYSASEVNEQIEVYKKEGFPEHYGLFETNVLVREHLSPECKDINESWWHEMEQYTLRDQLSFTYVLWKTKYGIDSISLLGNNPRKNPRLRYMLHS